MTRTITTDDRPEIEPAEADADAEPEDDLAPLDAVIAERDQWKDRALRAVAEAENTKRRAETQLNDARAYAIQRFARDLLGVADNLERALQAAPKDADAGEAGLVTGSGADPEVAAAGLREQQPQDASRPSRARPSTRTCIRR